MLEFPCGIADSYAIRRDGMVYVDRTSYLRDGERLGRILVFLRPRRFGKSLSSATAPPSPGSAATACGRVATSSSRWAWSGSWARR